jgi:hypothetical protein
MARLGRFLGHQPTWDMGGASRARPNVVGFPGFSNFFVLLVELIT